MFHNILILVLYSLNAQKLWIENSLIMSEIKRKPIKITLVGDSSVGKTCIIANVVDLEFREDLLATIGTEKMKLQ